VTTVRYRILGPLSVTVDGRSVAVTAGRDRVVLAMLLVNPNRIVGAGELIDALWGSAPPVTARGQLQSCISRLRRILPPGVILTDRAGYGIRVGPDDLDSEVFARSVEQARASGDRAAFRSALAVWRGPACAEFDAPPLRQAAAALDERYALAAEDWAELELAAGNERELAGELGVLVERFPLRERLREQLMLALARSGRQADALAEFRRARQLLADELGIEPGEELQKRHREVLNGETVADARPTGRVRCLPRTVGDFTGRAEQVERLAAEIEGSPGPVVAVIDGMAGSGKTTLALHVAALAGDRYPDAHLYIDLQGHSERDPVEPSEAVLVLLRQLGLNGGEIPAGRVDRIGRWRTELSRRRSLVVLDNAASSEQVADLLPTAPGSLAVVTSRRRLSGLDGVRVESLPVLSPEEAVSLLERIAGERVRAEPVAAAEVVRRCGYLPLAVRLAGARLAHRPRWRVSDLLRRLGEAALPELAAEDRTVTRAFTLTYRQLPAALQRTFRLLGVYPGVEFDALAVAALAGLAGGAAADQLDDLVDVHLIEEPEPGRYRMHDLVREYARTLAVELPEADRTAALTALLDFQLHAVTTANLGSYLPVLMRDLGSAEPARPDLRVPDPVARLERERPNLVAFVAAAMAAGRADYAWQIPRAAWHPLFYRGYTDDVRELHLLALPAAEASGDRSAIATTANYLASVYGRGGQTEKAEGFLRLAIRLRTELGQLGATAQSLGNLANIYYIQGRPAETVEVLRQALRMQLRARLPERSDMINMSSLLVSALTQLGRYDEALRSARAWLSSTIDDRNDGMTGSALLLLQRLRVRQGTMAPPVAHRYIDVSVRLMRRAGYQAGLADAAVDRARLHRIEGRHPEAIAEHQRALRIIAPQNDPLHESAYRCELAATLHAAGQIPAAREMYREALAIARRLRSPYQIAQALSGLAACLDPGDPEAARLRAEAGEVYARMGVARDDGTADRIGITSGAR
jgi:DNA-binding SARP family transcriptional activator/tetratricopeptide (TPR) repeat protein